MSTVPVNLLEQAFTKAYPEVPFPVRRNLAKLHRDFYALTLCPIGSGLLPR